MSNQSHHVINIGFRHHQWRCDDHSITHGSHDQAIFEAVAAADHAHRERWVKHFPALEFSSLSRNYETGYLDPWGRPSRYAPFIHYVCAVSFCKLDYGQASLLHMLVQTGLFFFFFVMTFKILEIESDLWMGLAATMLFLFVTPAGLSWFERGQFSLYVALAYLLLMVGLCKLCNLSY